MSRIFQVIFRGQPLAGFSLEQVKANVAKLYNTSVDNISGLFSGQAVVIKDQLDEPTAQKYAEVFRKQGAQCEVRVKAEATRADPSAGMVAQPKPGTSKVSTDSETGTPARKQQMQADTAEAMAPAPASNQPDDSNAGPGGQTSGVNLAAKCTVKLEEYMGSMTNTSVADAGSSLVEVKPIDRPDINTDGLQMAAAGEILVEAEPVPAADISIDELQLAPAGTDLND